MANNYPQFKSRSEAARRVLQKGARGIAGVEKVAFKGVAFWRRAGFPFRAPSVPRGVSVPLKEPHLGAYFDTSFARKPAKIDTAIQTIRPHISNSSRSAQAKTPLFQYK
jgi:hypothetical protein